MSYLFNAYDLAVFEHITHRIAVMYLGKIVEYADKRTLFTNPQHPYTEALLSAVPVPNPKLKRSKRLLQGDVPSPINPPPGCTFHTRCPYAEARCKVEVPKLTEISPGHGVSCHLRVNQQLGRQIPKVVLLRGPANGWDAGGAAWRGTAVAFTH